MVFESQMKVDNTIEIGRCNHSHGKNRTTYNKPIGNMMDG